MPSFAGVTVRLERLAGERRRGLLHERRVERRQRRGPPCRRSRCGPSARSATWPGRPGRALLRSRCRARGSIRPCTALPSTPSGTRTAVSGASRWSGSASSSRPRVSIAAWRCAAASAWRAQRSSRPSSSTAAAPRAARRSRGSAPCGGRRRAGRPSSARAAAGRTRTAPACGASGSARARAPTPPAATSRAAPPGTSACTSRRSRRPRRPRRAARRRARSRSRPSGACRDRGAPRPARRAGAPLRSRSRRGRPRPAGHRDAGRAPRSGASFGTHSPQSALTSTTMRAVAPRDLGDPPAEEPALRRRSPCRRARAGSRCRPPCRRCRCSAAAARARRASGRRAAACPPPRAGSRAGRGRGGRASACASPRARRGRRWSVRGRRAVARADRAGGSSWFIADQGAGRSPRSAS